MLAQRLSESRNKALDDNEVILKAWEVTVRRGWAFVIDTLLRGGIELFPPDSSSAEELGFWEGVGRGTQQELFSSTTDCTTVMASQESEDEEEEESLKNSSDLGAQNRSWPSWGGHGLNTNLATDSSSQEKSSVQREGKLNLSIDSKIQKFIAEATISFNKYFSITEMPTGDQALSATPTLIEESGNDPPVCHSVPLQAKPLAQQVAMVPAMPVSQPAAVTNPALQLPSSVTSLLPPLAAHLCKELQEAVVSLKYFNMFGLLPGRSHEAFESQIEMEKKDKSPHDRTIYKWQRAFAIMGSILLEHAPEKMKGFFNYGETIHSAYEKGQEKGWLIYDEKFRKLKEHLPDIGWDTIYSELWKQVCSKPEEVVSTAEVPPTKADAVVSTMRVPPTRALAVVSTMRVPPTRTKNASLVKPMERERGHCWMYDKDQCNMGSRCHYYHVCGNCFGEHPKKYCPLMNTVYSWPPLKRTR